MKTFAQPSRRTVRARRSGRTLSRVPVRGEISQRARIRHILQGSHVQPRLAVGAPDDVYEREADRVAEELLRMPDTADGPDPWSTAAPLPRGRPSVLRREMLTNAPTPEQIVDDEQFARRTGGAVARKRRDSPAQGEPAPADLEQAAGEAVLHRGPGRPLSAASRRFFEPRLGTDLEAVRLHEGASAATAAARLNARAFTHGTDIWLGAGEREGNRRLMGHELVHVLQNGLGAAGPEAVRRYTRTNTVYLWDVYVAAGKDPSAVTDVDLRTTIEYEDYTRADLIWKFSDTVALAALRRSMDLFVAGVRGRRPNYIRSAREARAAAHGLRSISLTALGFTGDHTVTAVPGTLGTATGSPIDDPDGSTPVWTSGGGSAHLVAYTLGTAPTMFASFQVSPAVSPAVTNVQVRARIGNTVVGSASGATLTGTTIESSSGSGQVTGIGGGAAVPGAAVGLIEPSIDFQVSTDGGRIWFDAGSLVVPMAFTAAAPAPPGGVLREDVLEWGGLFISASPSAAEGLRALVQSGVTYDPRIGMPGSFATSDAVMTAFTTPHQCDSQAFLLRFLALSFGIPASVLYFWLGTASQRFHYRVGSSSWLGPTFQCDRPAEDLAAHHPHFTFHALTSIGGVLHDAAYDRSGLPGILEHGPGATNQTGSRAAFLATGRHDTPFTCPH